MASGTIPDGVYVGFTYSGFKGDPFTHNFISIIHDGEPTHTFEYGPDQAWRNAPQQYQSRLEGATYGYTRVSPPQGMSESSFEKRIIDGAREYAAIPESRYPSYNVFIGSNCENMVSGLLKNAGVSQPELERIAEARVFGSIDPHVNKPFDLPSYLEENREHSQRRASLGRDSVPESGRLHVTYAGKAREFGPGFQQQGLIVEVDGDRVVQQVRNGETAVYSRQELLSRSSAADRAEIDRALRSGNDIRIGIDQSGVIDVRAEIGTNAHGIGLPPPSLGR
jgi:hypothetical protein